MTVTNIGGNAAVQLKRHIEIIEARLEQIDDIKEEVKAEYAAAKSSGLDVVAMRALIAERRKDPDKRQQQETMLDIYRKALGDLEHTPLGQAALKRVS